MESPQWSSSSLKDLLFMPARSHLDFVHRVTLGNGVFLSDGAFVIFVSHCYYCLQDYILGFSRCCSPDYVFCTPYLRNSLHLYHSQPPKIYRWDLVSLRMIGGFQLHHVLSTQWVKFFGAIFLQELFYICTVQLLMVVNVNHKPSTYPTYMLNSMV